jgi:hypothetical protein
VGTTFTASPDAIVSKPGSAAPGSAPATFSGSVDSIVSPPAQNKPAPTNRAAGLWKALNKPLPVGPNLDAMALSPVQHWADRKVAEEITSGNPVRAELAQFFAGSLRDVRNMATQMSTPLNLGLTIASAGEGTLGKLVGTGAIRGVQALAAGYFALDGLRNAVQGPLPGEKPADTIQRRLMGAGIAALGAAGTMAAAKDSLRNAAQKSLGLTGDLSNRVADKVAHLASLRNEYEQAEGERQAIREGRAERQVSNKERELDLSKQLKELPESVRKLKQQHIQARAERAQEVKEQRLSIGQRLRELGRGGIARLEAAPQVQEDFAHAIGNEDAKFRQDFNAIGEKIEGAHGDYGDLVHGTTSENAARIERSGKLSPAEGARQYDYSELGPDSIYLGRPGSFWYSDPESARAIRYEREVPVHLSSAANVYRVSSDADLENLARRAGFSSARELLDAAFVDNLKDPEGPRPGDMAKSREAVSKLKRLGIDALDVGDISGLAHDQVIVFNPDVVKLGRASSGPIADAGSVRRIILSEVEKAKAKPGEIPAAAFKALGREAGTGGGIRPFAGSEAEMAPEDLPEGVLEALKASGYDVGGKDLTFKDLTRVRHDLYDAAYRNSDHEVSYGLRQAAEKITDMQEAAADKAGVGKEYRALKGRYAKYINEIGDGPAAKLLSAVHHQDQVLGKYFAAGMTWKDELVLGDLFKKYGVSTPSLDKVYREIESLSKERESIRSGKSEYLQRQKEKADVEAAQGRAEAAAEPLQRELEQLRSPRSEYLRQRAEGQRLTELAGRSKELKGEMAAANKPEKGRAAVVPGTPYSELTGKSEQQLREMRVRALMDAGQTQGITKPWRLALLILGLGKLMMGSMWGVSDVAIGAGPSIMNKITGSPALQKWLASEAGVANPAALTKAIEHALRTYAKSGAYGFQNQ